MKSILNVLEEIGKYNMKNNLQYPIIDPIRRIGDIHIQENMSNSIIVLNDNVGKIYLPEHLNHFDNGFKVSLIIRNLR